MLYVEQEPSFPEGATPVGVLLASSSSDDVAAYRAYTRAEAALRTVSEERGADAATSSAAAASAAAAFERASKAMDVHGGWAVGARVERTLARLGIAHLATAPLAGLSGGERKRLALAGALLAAPDVLLLDEASVRERLAGVRVRVRVRAFSRVCARARESCARARAACVQP